MFPWELVFRGEKGGGAGGKQQADDHAADERGEDHGAALIGVAGRVASRTPAPSVAAIPTPIASATARRDAE